MTYRGRRTVVIGVGNPYRRDDGVGPAVIELLRGQVPAEVELVVIDGNPVRLIETWSGASLAVVVDAVRAERPQPGRRHRFVLDGEIPEAARAGPGAHARPGTHGLGLEDAFALGLVLDRLPRRLVVHAIEAADLTHGAGMTPGVAAAAGATAAAVRRDISDGCGRPPWCPEPDASPRPRPGAVARESPPRAGQADPRGSDANEAADRQL